MEQHHLRPQSSERWVLVVFDMQISVWCAEHNVVATAAQAVQPGLHGSDPWHVIACSTMLHVCACFCCCGSCSA
jgi:hypothetical protein